MGSVRVVLSDLDDTLFDHHRATRAALIHVQSRDTRLARWPLAELERRHSVLLEMMHAEVLAGRMSIDDARVERFRQLLADGSSAAPAEFARNVASTYRQAYERSWYPVDGAAAMLELLKPSGVTVVVVTNNSIVEQRQKLDRTGLSKYVDWLVTSEEVGCCKPDARIFRAALERARGTADEAVMLGDAWATDIEGARNSGIRAVWLNRFGAPLPDRDVPELVSLSPAARVVQLLMAE
jgi:HAD superfamily hydrolase (TIGR01549 family)